VHLRRNTRTWLTTAGQVAEKKLRRRAPRSSVEWEAHVVDTATNQAVKDYPHLHGTDVFDVSDAHESDEITKLYIERCRFVDGEKLDIKLLQENLNAGVWTVATTIKGTKPINPV
jgi:hypothetical protein